MPYANELLLAELKVYEFSDKSSKSILSYLTIIGTRGTIQTKL